MHTHLDMLTEHLSQTVHHIDVAILRGASSTSTSISAIRLRQIEDKLRRMADEVEKRRARLVNGQPGLPFRQAAE
jgi:hypothetical protein